MFAHLIVERASSSKLKHLFMRYFDSQNAGHGALALLCFIDIDTDEAVSQIKNLLVFSERKNSIYKVYLFIYFINTWKQIITKSKEILGDIRRSIFRCTQPSETSCCQYLYKKS